MGSCCFGLAAAETPASKLWIELKAKRENLPGAHQEFEASQTFKTSRGSQSLKRELVIDLSGGHSRERSISGSGNQIRIFDGKELFRMEGKAGRNTSGSKRHAKEDDPAPSPYTGKNPEWSKARELERPAPSQGLRKTATCVWFSRCPSRFGDTPVRAAALQP